MLTQVKLPTTEATFQRRNGHQTRNTFYAVNITSPKHQVRWQALDFTECLFQWFTTRSSPLLPSRQMFCISLLKVPKNPEIQLLSTRNNFSLHVTGLSRIEPAHSLQGDSYSNIHKLSPSDPAGNGNINLIQIGQALSWKTLTSLGEKTQNPTIDNNSFLTNLLESANSMNLRKYFCQ